MAFKICVCVCLIMDLRSNLKWRLTKDNCYLILNYSARPSCENHDHLFLEFQFTVFLSSLECGMFASLLYLALISSSILFWMFQNTYKKFLLSLDWLEKQQFLDQQRERASKIIKIPAKKQTSKQKPFLATSSSVGHSIYFQITPLILNNLSS